MKNKKDNQTANSLNNSELKSDTKKTQKNYKQKYKINPKIMNRYAAWVSNPTVQPDETTEMGVPIPSELNTEFSKEYQEENKL